MFSIFRKKKDEGPPQLLDIDGQPLAEGDIVTSLRYDMGDCKVELEGKQYFYQSLGSDQPRKLCEDDRCRDRASEGQKEAVRSVVKTD